MDTEEVGRQGQEKIKIGKELIQHLNLLRNIPGVTKIQKKISAEIASLQNVSMYNFQRWMDC